MIKTNEITKQCTQWQPKLAALRRQLHQFPEITPNLSQTKSLLIDYLASLPLKRQTVKNNNTLCFDLKGKKKGPMILLCAAMDGSSIRECSNEKYCSQISGQSHSLAHDAQMACLATTLHFLSQYKNDLCGTVRAVFLAGEQDHSGATRVIESNLLKDVQMAFSLDFDNQIEKHCVEYHYGISKPRVDEILIECTGQPDQPLTTLTSSNPVEIAANLIRDLPQSLRKEFGDLTPLSMQFLQINASKAFHFQPSQIRIKGRLYAFENDLALKAIGFIQNTIQTQFQHSNTNVKTSRLCPPLMNNTGWLNYVLSVLGHIKSPNQLKEQTRPRLMGDGFAHFNQFVPSVKISVGCKNEINRLAIDEDSLTDGLSILSTLVIKHLGEANKNIILAKFNKK